MFYENFNKPIYDDVVGTASVGKKSETKFSYLPFRLKGLSESFDKWEAGGFSHAGNIFHICFHPRCISGSWKHTAGSTKMNTNPEADPCTHGSNVDLKQVLGGQEVISVSLS